MRKAKKIRIDINELIARNPSVDAGEVAHNLEVLEELKRRGVKVGPNYNLGSPFSRPEPGGKESEPRGSTLHQA